MATIDPLQIPTAPLSRLTTQVVPLPKGTPDFKITAVNRSYHAQYASIYYVRLRLLSPAVDEHASKRWGAMGDTKGTPPPKLQVLDVVKSQTCYLIGTVYMDMPLKPNVLEDIARDHSIPAPPPPDKFNSPDDSVMLEDESGRIRLVGGCLEKHHLVTGIVIGVLGMETPDGDFEAVDICYPGLPPQLNTSSAGTSKEDDAEMDLDEPGPSGLAPSSSSSSPSDEWIAAISGLDVGSVSPADAQIQMLVEYLTGEEGGLEDQKMASQISRLIIVGNSLATPVPAAPGTQVNGIEERRNRRHGQEAASFSAQPILTLSEHLSEIAAVMPIHILPGKTDPSGTIMPQQAFPRAMFGAASQYSTFACETNPTYVRIAPGPAGAPEHAASSGAPPRPARTFLVTSGQPLDDMCKYVATPPATRLQLAACSLRWRHAAPTAPDTLWCHPYFEKDPFIVPVLPDVYVVGNQPRFETRVVESTEDDEGPPRRCRIVLVPKFAETGILVLINMRTLELKTVRFAVKGMTTGGATAS